MYYENESLMYFDQLNRKYDFNKKYFVTCNIDPILPPFNLILPMFSDTEKWGKYM